MLTQPEYTNQKLVLTDIAICGGGYQSKGLWRLKLNLSDLLPRLLSWHIYYSWEQGNNLSVEDHSSNLKATTVAPPSVGRSSQLTDNLCFTLFSELRPSCLKQSQTDRVLVCESFVAWVYHCFHTQQRYVSIPVQEYVCDMTVYGKIKR